ncbi:DUF368 domain-containing protein [Pokkaliibacter plantistimulans]|nr:DUF368 domain-containing protein [Pokkaliibacter plantistimulans]
MERIFLFLKGMAMGAADVVPGVSGGTIAFISGIYEELLLTIRNIHPRLFFSLFRKGVLVTWREANGSFLAVLLAGILTSILTLAKGISWLLEFYPLLIWGFFFGLVMASCLLIARQVERWRTDTLLSLVLGALLGWILTQGFAFSMPPTSFNLFIGGAIAICAMILPGISGSFILLILGLYQPVLSAVKQLQFSTLLIFVCGCVTGLMGFSRVLSWCLQHYRAMTLAILTGFMVGSLGKVWPWKITRAYRLDSHGQSVPLLQDSVLPHSYQGLTGQAPMTFAVVALMLLGVMVVLGLSRAASVQEARG